MEITPEIVEFIRQGIHRLGCTPNEPDGKTGRYAVRSDLVSPLGDKSGEYPCLCSEYTIRYNGQVIYTPPK